MLPYRIVVDESVEDPAPEVDDSQVRGQEDQPSKVVYGDFVSQDVGRPPGRLLQG